MTQSVSDHAPSGYAHPVHDGGTRSGAGRLERRAGPAAQSSAGGRFRSLLIVLPLLALGAGAAFLTYYWWSGFPPEPAIGTPAQQSSSSPAQQASSLPATKAHIVFSGQESELSAAPGNVVQLDDSRTPPIVWLRSSVTTARSAGRTDAVSATVPRALARQLEGRRVVVTVTAARGSDPASPFAVAYSAGGAGNSGWVVFAPTNSFKDHSFTYTVPMGPASDTEPHVIGIWSDISGRHAPLALRQIKVRIAD